jgi:hypothetical protein
MSAQATARALVMTGLPDAYDKGNEVRQQWAWLFELETQ